MFSDVYTVDVPGSTNRELFASNNDNMMEIFYANINAESNDEIHSLMDKVSSGLTEYIAGNYLMTDDKAPVELLGMQVIDEIILSGNSRIKFGNLRHYPLFFLSGMINWYL
ncbi:MAG: hypothetical protein PUA62_02900 [Lachnospiraceae bacterium]|nr:hypothetical protein [Lachnospiraceae bacterium]